MGSEMCIRDSSVRSVSEQLPVISIPPSINVQDDNSGQVQAISVPKPLPGAPTEVILGTSIGTSNPVITGNRPTNPPTRKIPSTARQPVATDKNDKARQPINPNNNDRTNAYVTSFGNKVRPNVQTVTQSPPRTNRRPLTSPHRVTPFVAFGSGKNRRKDGPLKTVPRPKGRPNQVAIDVPSYDPRDKIVVDHFGKVITTEGSPTLQRGNDEVPKEPFIPPPTAILSQFNPNKRRKPAATGLGDKNIGIKFDIVTDHLDKENMREVSITGSDGKVAVIQTRYVACLLYTSPSPRDS